MTENQAKAVVKTVHRVANEAMRELVYAMRKAGISRDTVRQLSASLARALTLASKGGWDAAIEFMEAPDDPR